MTAERLVIELASSRSLAQCPTYTAVGGITSVSIENKKLSYRRVTARCVVSVEILPTATQQCRNYLYDKS